MIVDCHYHLDRRLLSDEDLLRSMDDCGVDKVALMAVLNDPIPKPAEFLLNILRFSLTHGAFRFLAKRLAANFTAEGNIKIPAGVFQLYPDPENEAVFQAVAAHPERFLGWVFVNPRGEKDPLQELERWKAVPGWVGVKAHPFWHRYPPKDLLQIAERLYALGKPLLIHAGFDTHGDYGRLLQQVPGLKLIVAHAGFPMYSDSWPAIRDSRRVYVDLSQTSYLDAATTHQAVEYLGVEKCLFGTDGPYGVHGRGGLYDYGFIKRRLERLFPDKGIQARLLGENFLELVGM